MNFSNPGVAKLPFGHGLAALEQYSSSEVGTSTSYVSLKRMVLVVCYANACRYLVNSVSAFFDDFKKELVFLACDSFSGKPSTCNISGLLA